jgi:archaetidylinositol phosphate synthase
LLTKFKEKVQSLLTAHAKTAHNLGLTPNHLSVLGILFAFFSALTYAMWSSHPAMLILASALLLVSGFCDALDGAVARIYRETTVFGGFFDSLLDRYADSMVLCGITLGGLCEPGWGFAAVTGSLLVSYARSRAEAEGVKMESVGFFERPERIIFLTIVSIAAAIWLGALSWGIILLAILTNLTAIQRTIYFYKASK